MPSKKSMEDTFILDLKKLVDDTTLPPEEKTTSVLHKLQDAMARASVGPDQDLVDLKRRLIDANILEYCLVAMRLDHVAMDTEARWPKIITMETWRTTVQLAQFLSSCCVGAEPEKDHQAFYRLFLPSVMDGLLALAYRLMSQIAERTECLSLFRTVMDSVGWLLGAYSCLTPQVLSSLYYERMQVSDEVIVSLVCVSLWSQICSTNSDFLSGLSEDSVLLLINDAVGQLAVSSEDAVGGACIGLLVLIANQMDRQGHSLLQTFTGLDRLLNKDWRKRGFNQEIDQLMTVLDSDWPTAEHSHTQACSERVRAACVIQAAWRGHVTRNRMKNLPRAVSVLQRTYRAKVRQRKLLEQTSRWEAELRHQVYMRRQRSRRRFHQKQKQLLHLLPAELVQRFQRQLEESAAMAIQRWWRGHRERRVSHTLRHTHTQHRAAHTLQRGVLHFLRKRRALQAPPTLKLIGRMDLTEKQRAELNKEVEHYVRHNPSGVVSQQGCEQLLLQAQSLLLQRHTQPAQHTHALLAHINTQLDLLDDAPCLSVATATDGAVFHSRSGPVVFRAQQSHDALLQASSLPWGNRLEIHDDVISTPSPPLQESGELCWI